MKKHHESHSSSHKHEQTSDNKMPMIIGAILIVLAIAALIYYVMPKAQMHSNAVAIVNGERISESNFSMLFNRLPAESKNEDGRLKLLNDSIDELLLVQDARKAGVVVTNLEVTKMLDDQWKAAGLSEADIQKRLSDYNATMDQVMAYYTKMLLVNKHLNSTLGPKVTVSEEEMLQFYDTQLKQLNYSYTDYKDQINQTLTQTKIQNLFNEHLASLKRDAKIEIIAQK